MKLSIVSKIHLNVVFELYLTTSALKMTPGIVNVGDFFAREISYIKSLRLV